MWGSHFPLNFGHDGQMGSPRRTFKNVHLHLCRYHKNLVCFHFLLMDDHFCLRFSGRHDYCIPFGWCHLQFFRMGVGILHSGRCMSDLGGSLVVLCIRYTRGARLHIARRSRLHWSSLKQSFTTHHLSRWTRTQNCQKLWHVAFANVMLNPFQLKKMFYLHLEYVTLKQRWFWTELRQ